MEDDILRLLRQSLGQAYSIKQIGKMLDRHRFREDANWARPLLVNLASRQLIEKDSDGRYFIPNEEEFDRS